MHEVLRAGIEIDVLLDIGAASARIMALFPSLILVQQSVCSSLAREADLKHKWEIAICNHGFYYCVSLRCEPTKVEI